ncbi:AraC family transcriptional regulator [Frigidibacter sp. MR17.24]|uniref:AraC family transcriptional regulator n=1 Tax=Frigidibacter sp. MR17.24 TaxID=3127345 RepID=UPI003012B973
MPQPRPRDTASLRSRPELFGIETLQARYLSQSFKPHAHDDYLFGVIEGGVHAVWCRGEMHRVPGGSVVTMRPGDVHHGGAGDEGGWRQRMLYIPEAGLRELVADITGRAPRGTLDFGAAFHAQPALGHRFAALHARLHDAPEALVRDEALVALMRLLLAGLAPDPDGPRPDGRGSGADGRIADAVDYLGARLDEDVSLAELCGVTGLGRRQTIEAFRRVTGLPPHAWHLQARIAHVKRLLRAGVAPAAAAAEAGFADQSHMGRHFRAIVGATPAACARG